MKMLAVTSVLFGLAYLVVTTSAEDSSKLPKVTEKVIFDIEINGQKQGSIVIGLFGEIVPKTVEIFTKLAKAKEGKGYKGSKLSRFMEDRFIKGGDISTDDATEDGSVCGGLPNDENFTLKHDMGTVSVANSAKNRGIGFDFFICLRKTTWLDGNHVVFGKVLEGFDVLRKIARGCKGSPSKDCEIADSVVVEVDEPFSPDI